jgi:acyl-homoserine-lactone acylase
MAQGPTAADQVRWKAEAARVTIVRDDWGIAHVRGPSDADAVFGMIFAQCEDDFNRIEMNYLTSVGRRAEAEGEATIWRICGSGCFWIPKSSNATMPPARSGSDG